MSETGHLNWLTAGEWRLNALYSAPGRPGLPPPSVHSAAVRDWLRPCMEGAASRGAAAMAMDGPEIERLIKQAFPDAQVIIVDMAGDGDHFAARVTSEAFKGKSRVQQHQMVYAALQGQMGGVLHALALETLVPK